MKKLLISFLFLLFINLNLFGVKVSANNDANFQANLVKPSAGLYVPFSERFESPSDAHAVTNALSTLYPKFFGFRRKYSSDNVNINDLYSRGLLALKAAIKSTGLKNWQDLNIASRTKVIINELKSRDNQRKEVEDRNQDRINKVFIYKRLPLPKDVSDIVLEYNDPNSN